VDIAADRIDVIFWEAAQLAPGAERDDYLARACGDDRELRQRVEKLVRAQPKVEGFLERPFAGPAPTPDLAVVREGPGDRIGPYKLLEQIGEGGMGLVFMAEQTEPVRRKVALKVLKPGMDTRQVVARFEAERQALALMDHPNIAKVLDAGETASGRPYFVMELVRGVAVTDFCDQHRLDPRARLHLFVSVCRAVQHAHQKGVMHRDLKPSNILVTLHDTVPVPKVIDFGVAKAIGQPLTERTLFTRFAQMVGTPMYMSPEQAEMNGLDVDTRSDVYALGVLLYELLTGTTPFEGDTLRRAGLDEIRRMIREEEPPRPSRRLSTLAAERQSTLSERRGVDGRRLGRLLRGELDWVVMRALEKDRDRRYESASALAADVQRYLGDEPVDAGPPTALYRVRKYVRRHRRLLATAGVILAVLLGATAVSIWQAALARDAQHQAETAEGRAATEAAIARAVNDFLMGDVLGRANSVSQFCDEIGSNLEITVKEALDRAAAKIGERFQDQPLVEAAIRRVIADSYQNLGRHQSTLVHYEREVALRKAHLGPNHADTLTSMENLGKAYSWAGQDADAIAVYQQLLENRRARLGPNDPETLASMTDLARAYHEAGLWDKSTPLLEQVYEKQSAICGPAHADTVETMHELAWSYLDVDRITESIALHEKALGWLKATNVAGQPPRNVWWIIGFAMVCQKGGNLDRSDQLLREALEQNQNRDDTVGRRGQLAHIRGRLALNLLLRKKYDEAEPLIRQSAATFEKLYPGTFRCSFLMAVHGAVLTGQQRYAEAEPVLLKGYEGMAQSRVPHGEHGELAEVGGWVVRFYEVTNQPEKAHAWREKLAAARRTNRDP
jgi:serine/threonine protein kinase